MTGNPETTGRKQDGKFRKGRSGNPTGRPAGARHRVTLAAEAILDGESEAVTRKAVEMALGGDSSMIRLCLERILPVRRDRPVSINLPPLNMAADAVTAMSAIVAAVQSGDLTPEEADRLASMVSGYVKAVEASELEKRIMALEQRSSMDRR